MKNSQDSRLDPDLSRTTTEFHSTIGDHRFEDLGSDLSLTTLAGDVLQRRILFGTGEAESAGAFNTGASVDHVYGGGGLDTLLVRNGKDTTEGYARDKWRKAAWE